MAEDIQQVNALDCSDNSCFYANFRTYCTALLNVKLVFFSRPWSEGWPHHGRTFSIYPCPLSFWLTLPLGILSTSWCCPSRPCVAFLACVHLAQLKHCWQVFFHWVEKTFFPNVPGKNSFCWQNLVFFHQLAKNHSQRYFCYCNPSQEYCSGMWLLLILHYIVSLVGV